MCVIVAEAVGKLVAKISRLKTKHSDEKQEKEISESV